MKKENWATAPFFIAIVIIVIVFVFAPYWSTEDENLIANPRHRIAINQDHQYEVQGQYGTDKRWRILDAVDTLEEADKEVRYLESKPSDEVVKEYPHEAAKQKP